MGEIVRFPSNGVEGQGYLALPPGGGTGSGLLLIQEWWGLVPHIEGLADRFAATGFVTLAPDLYRGEVTRQPDRARELMMAMNLAQAGRDMSGAVDCLRDHPRATGDGVGVVGFCMGGGLAYMLAAQRPDAVRAIVPFYGAIPWPEVQPDWSAIEAAIQGHYAEHDHQLSAEYVDSLEERLRGLGKDVEFFRYPGTSHAFFNDSRPEVHDPRQAAVAWERALDFLRRRLGTPAPAESAR